MTADQTSLQRSNLAAAHSSFRKGLNAYALYRIHDQSITDDIVQDTFMKTWLYLVRGGKIDIMKAFLYHVLKNLIIDEYRKHSTTSLDALLEKGFEPVYEQSDLAYGHLDNKSIVSLIGTIPLMYQKVVRMRYVQDLSLREISLITGQTKNAIAVQIHRGLRKLKIVYLMQ